jgi:hypothetical protein
MEHTTVPQMCFLCNLLPLAGRPGPTALWTEKIFVVYMNEQNPGKGIMAKMHTDMVRLYAFEEGMGQIITLCRRIRLVTCM